MSEQIINYIASPTSKIQGEIKVPGDKSVSHRSIMLGSLADGVTHVSGFLEGEDALATLKAFKALGVKIEGPDNGEVTIHGVGMNGLQKPSTNLDLGNSGTSMRLMAGLLSGQNFECTLTGDRSLSSRPMKRVTEPLALMNANIETNDGKAPLFIKGSNSLKAIHYDMPIASAQVKSCLLLAGMYAEGVTSVIEPGVTRDHTERMLQAFQYPVTTKGNKISLEGGHILKACDLSIPGDISSAAFFMVGASIAEGSELLIKNVGINPTRTGVIDILKLMGGDLSIVKEYQCGGEPVADILVKSAKLKGIVIPEHLVPLAIDEFPVLFVAAACAEGTTVLTGAKELRVKESDRIQVMADGLVTLGIDAKPTEDGIIINGGKLTSGKVYAHDDHRIAMSFSIASLCSKGIITIEDCANVVTSFPGFVGLANSVGMSIQEEYA